jgi:hypothetical protein
VEKIHHVVVVLHEERSIEAVFVQKLHNVVIRAVGSQNGLGDVATHEARECECYKGNAEDDSEALEESPEEITGHFGMIATGNPITDEVPTGFRHETVTSLGYSDSRIFRITVRISR